MALLLIHKRQEQTFVNIPNIILEILEQSLVVVC